MSRRTAPVLLTLVVLLGAALAATIGVRNYRGIRNLVEADPPSPELREPPGRTGIARLQEVRFAGRDWAQMPHDYAAA